MLQIHLKKNDQLETCSAIVVIANAANDISVRWTKNMEEPICTLRHFLEWGSDYT